MNYLEKDKKFIWHPFTQMKIAGEPVHINKAMDATLYSTDGREFIDAISSWWVTLHGHSNKTIAAAISQQAHHLEQVIFAGFTHTPAIEISEKLIGILPDHLAKVFFSDNGSTTVEVAIKMALQYWYNQGIHHKTKIIAFENAYHGDTFGAMSAGARSKFNDAFAPLLFEVHHIPVPRENTIDEIKTQFLQLVKEDTVAAFIFEPLVQGAGGMQMYKPEYLDQLLSLAVENDIVCIADEVMTGFGRTGKNFAINYLLNRPDIICLSKGITGGFMPLGVTACSQKIFDAFYADEMEKTFFHGHSYTANPLACAAANASLELLLGEKCQSQIKTIGDRHTAFAGTIEKNDFVKEVRQQGTILAVELNTPESTSYFNTIKKEAYQFYLKNGVLLRPLGNVVYIMPPYCITEKELDKVYSVIIDSLSYLKEKCVDSK